MYYVPFLRRVFIWNSCHFPCNEILFLATDNLGTWQALGECHNLRRSPQTQFVFSRLETTIRHSISNKIHCKSTTWTRCFQGRWVAIGNVVTWLTAIYVAVGPALCKRCNIKHNDDTVVCRTRTELVFEVLEQAVKVTLSTRNTLDRQRHQPLPSLGR